MTEAADSLLFTVQLPLTFLRFVRGLALLTVGAVTLSCIAGMLSVDDIDLLSSSLGPQDLLPRSKHVAQSWFFSNSPDNGTG